jgi:membrane protein DedA with SNARE-associated domain
MSDLLQFLVKHGYAVIFGSAFVEQMGVPIPAATLIVGMGALSRSGEFSIASIVATAGIAALIADLIWYELGRHHGRSVLRLICRISLEPDYCVRRTEDGFEKLGLWVLLMGKFIPGFNAAAVPLAGMMKTSLPRFLAVDIVGVMLWSGTYTMLGYVFSQQIELTLMYLSTLGTSRCRPAGLVHGLQTRPTPQVCEGAKGHANYPGGIESQDGCQGQHHDLRYAKSSGSQDGSSAYSRRLSCFAGTYRVPA